VDFGGTKIEAALMSRDGEILARERVANPRRYAAALDAVAALIESLGAAPGQPVGVAIPGSLSPADGRVRNANSTWLNGRPFDRDLVETLGRKVRLANDANCFVLSETRGGSADGSASAFGVILGTGCGGGLAIGGRLIAGANAIAGEWGHAPLPSPGPGDIARPCWCGRLNCMETFVSGPAFAADYEAESGRRAEPPDIAALAADGDAPAARALDRLIDRLGRGLAMVVNILDPEVIVLGGGLSNIDSLYDRLPAAIRPHVFSDSFGTAVVRHAHGDSSGVRGAAWLWEA